MIETMPRAVCAILQALSSKEQVQMDRDEINNQVFHGMADEQLLRAVLREMKNDGLVQMASGNFKALPRGLHFLDTQRKVQR